MNYEHTMTAVFLSRPNRFLAHVLLDGREVVCHVKNTGRLKELLNPGVPVVIQHHPDAKATGRKTEYSLIAVARPVLGGSRWVNIDSQAPNQAAYEWLSAGDGLPFCPRPTDIRREVSHGGSRFDLAFSCQGQPWFMEVKGVTLNVNGQARFPDAPTRRKGRLWRRRFICSADAGLRLLCPQSQSSGIRRGPPVREGSRRPYLGLGLRGIGSVHEDPAAGAGHTVNPLHRRHFESPHLKACLHVLFVCYISHK